MWLNLVAIGVLAIILTKAASTVAKIEPEQGTKTGLAYNFLDPQASSGKAVKFQQTCAYVAPVPANLWGAMDYVNYDFLNSDIHQLEHEVDVLNSPASNSDYYIQMYDADIGAGQQYFGIQTTGLAIWSRWNTGDLSNVRPAGNTYTVGGIETGANFVSLRRKYSSFPSGHYKTRISRAEFDGVGDWYGFYVTFPGGSEDHIGDIRFPRSSANVPAAFHDGGGQWNEFWDNNNGTLRPVPLLQLNVKAIANGNINAVHARGLYSSMPNSDLSAVTTAGQYVHHELGGQTGRCNKGDSTGHINLW